MEGTYLVIPSDAVLKKQKRMSENDIQRLQTILIQTSD